MQGESQRSENNGVGNARVYCVNSTSSSCVSPSFVSDSTGGVVDWAGLPLFEGRPNNVVCRDEAFGANLAPPRRIDC